TCSPPSTSDIYTLSLHDALPICAVAHVTAAAVGSDERRPSRFAAAAERMHQPFAVRIARPFVNRTQRGDLGRSEATVGLRAGALDRRGVPAALAGIVDQAVLKPVLPVARRHGRGLRELQIGRRETAVVAGERLVAEDRAGLRLERIDGGAGADRIVIFREALRFHQRHAATGGAALEVGAAVRLAVVCRDELLAGDGHLVNRAVAEIPRRFRIGRPARVPDVAGCVPTVGLQRGVTLAQTFGRRLQGDVALPASAAEAEHLAVPARGQPIDDADVGAADRRERRGYFAEAGQAVRFLDPLAARGGGADHRGSDRGTAIGPGESREAGGARPIFTLRRASRGQRRESDGCE